MNKTGASPFISVHLNSSYFSPSGENRQLKTHKGATSCWPQPGQSKRSILMIPDKMARQYPPGCDDSLHYSGRIDRKDDMGGLCRGRTLESLQCAALTCADSTMSPFDLTRVNCLNNCIRALSGALYWIFVCGGSVALCVCAPDKCVCMGNVLAGTRHVQTLPVIEDLMATSQHQ